MLQVTFSGEADQEMERLGCVLDENEGHRDFAAVSHRLC